MRFLFGMILVIAFLLPTLGGKDIVRNRSPDGKFALKISETDSGSEVAIVDLVRFFKQLARLLPFANISPIAGRIVETLRIIWILLHRQPGNFKPAFIVVGIFFCS